MKPAAVFSEAWRNLLSGASRAVWFILALTIFGAGLGIADVSATGALISKANAYKASGAAITTFVAQGQIDGRQCAQLSEVPGVTAAGAMRSVDNVKLLALPGSPVPAKEVTAGFPQVLGTMNGSSSTGVFISREVADEFGIHEGKVRPETIDTDQGPAEVAGIYDYPADGRRPGLGYALLLPTSTEAAFDECWVASWPQTAEIRTLIRSALTPNGTGSTTEQPIVAQLNTRNGTFFDGPEQFNERITRLGGPVALFGGAVLGYLFVRLRRLELAAARHSGVRPVDQAAQLGIEATLATAAVWILSIPAIAYATRGSADYALIIIGLKPLLIAGITFITSASLSSFGTKEMHLYKYFKSR